MKGLCALILAAGKGTRMLSDRAKVLHEVCGRSMMEMVYSTAVEMEPDEIFVVIGQDAELVRATVGADAATFVVQEPQLGTGHAVICSRNELARHQGDVLVLSGDAPRIKPATLAKLHEHHRSSGAATTILTTQPLDPKGYGRVVRGRDGSVDAIVEERDATPEQRKIREINAAFYCFRIPDLLVALDKLSSENDQKEYYLTDVIAIHKLEGKRVEAVLHEDSEELQGINNRRELAKLSKELWMENNLRLMADGVTIVDPDRTYIDPQVSVDRDVIIYPQVILQGRTTVAESSIVHSGTRVKDSRIGSRVEILDLCVITDSEIGGGTVIGPSAHLHSRTLVGKECRIGNFVEIKNTRIGDRSKACHLSYLGDAMIGSDVNVGAGTITCNFDGQNKNATIIEDGAFIGTSSQLVAPVRIGKNAFVAAGSCITEDVPAGALGIARSRQSNKAGWKPQKDRKNS